jgi:hypothetical protein
MVTPTSLVRATAQIQFDAAPAATDAITIGNIVYTYIATPASAYDVDVGADLTASVANLVAAINKSGGGASTYYETGTLANPFMSAVASATNRITLSARVPGTAGNGIYLLSSETDIDIEEVGDTATLFSTQGTGVLEDALISLLDEVQLNSEAIALLRTLTTRSTD